MIKKTVLDPKHLLSLILSRASPDLIIIIDFISHSFPLQAFLEDEKILKVGVGPNEDSNYLAEDYNIQVR